MYEEVYRRKRFHKKVSLTIPLKCVALSKHSLCQYICFDMYYVVEGLQSAVTYVMINAEDVFTDKVFIQYFISFQVINNIHCVFRF